MNISLWKNWLLLWLTTSKEAFGEASVLGGDDHRNDFNNNISLLLNLNVLLTSHPEYLVPIMNINVIIRQAAVIVTGVDTLVLMGNGAQHIGDTCRRSPAHHHLREETAR